jgi:aquaporin Z
LELILTFFLLFTIGALSKKENSMMAGWVIGSVVLLEALFAGPISGASMNPVRSLAPAIWSNNVQSLWIYLTAPFIGAYLGILLSDVLERKPDHEY